MDLSGQLDLLAGLVALALGVGALARDPRGVRNRVFAGLCGALAVWLVGVSVPRLLGEPLRPWDRLYLAGACAAPALALHFARHLAGSAAAGRRRVAVGYTAAAVLYLSAWTPLRDDPVAWNAIAIPVLGAMLAAAGWSLARRARTLKGPARGVSALVLGTAVTAALGGLSDLVPRPDPGIPRVGSALLLPFLLVLCAVVVRHRFLDLDRFLALALAVAVGSAISALWLSAVVRLAGARFLPLLAGSAVLLLAAGPVGRALLRRSQRLLGSGSQVTRALTAASARVPLARDPAEIWSALRAAWEGLPPEARLVAFVRREDGESYRPVARFGRGGAPPAVARTSALVRLLESDREPLTRRFLEEGAGAGGAESALQQAALEELDLMGVDLVAPLLRGATLHGWLALGGAPQEELTAELAAALSAAGQQVVASLERLEAVAAARRAEALAAVAEAAATLAHEIRNPVGALRGAAQVLKDSEDPEVVGEMLEVIEEETARLGRVTGALLDHARPASVRREPVDLAEVVRSVVRELASAGLGMETRVEARPDLRAALGDPDELHRVLANLARNAREAAGEHGVLRIEMENQGADRVVVRLVDDGPGFSDEQAALAFAPSYTGRSGGTGLGLALVQRLVDAHGGRVSLESGPGLGAAFTISLPAAGVG